MAVSVSKPDARHEVASPSRHNRAVLRSELVALCDRALDEREVAATVTNHGDRGGASDGLESDAYALGFIYSTNYEHNAVLRRHFDEQGGQWETVVHDPRLLWPDTLSVATDGYLYVTSNCTSKRSITTGKICAANPTRCSVCALMPSLFCCVKR